MAPDLAAELLGAVNAMRVEMDRRFLALGTGMEALNSKVDEVCVKVVGLETAQAVDAALAKQADQTAQSHTLDIRWRVGIGLAAATGLGALLLNLFNVFVIGK